MKLPSVHTLWIHLKSTLARFPLQVLIAVVASAIWCCLVDPGKDNQVLADRLLRILIVCNLVFTSSLAADLFSEINRYSLQKKWGLRLLTIAIGTALFFLLRPNLYLADVFRTGLLVFAFHLLVAFAPFLGRTNLNEFWQYNKSLFLRFLTSALYAFVLYAGLAVALLAIDGLFNVKIDWQVYMRLFAVVAAGFTTIFFLAGIPKDLPALDQEDSYPKGLKIFTQYVLIPLMTIYLVILLVYEVQIILKWELPKGLVSTLILGYAVFGILSLLLIYPIREKEGNGWIKLFSKFFYVMLLPLVVLLLLAVWKRVDSYGITESRYILTVLAVWLSFITGYFLISSKQNIKMIPLSLCLLALLATYGPQSAFSVSRYSQQLRLKKLTNATNKKDLAERAEVVDYLVDRHGLPSLQKFTSVNLTELEDRITQKGAKQSRYLVKERMKDTAFALLNVKKVGRSYLDHITLVPAAQEATEIKGYDYVVALDGYASITESKIKGQMLKISREENSRNLRVQIGNEPAVQLDVHTLVRKAVAEFKAGKLKEVAGADREYELSPELLSIYQSTAHFEFKLVLYSLKTATDVDNEQTMQSWLSYDGYLLIRSK